MKPQDPRGYYEVLGVPADASAEAIKRAFRAVAMECHPDKNADSRAAARFRKLSEAYAVLSDDRSRATYDRRSDPGRRARARGADARAADAAGDAQAASAAAAPGELIHCSCCNRPTAQPRHAVYWTVISVLVTWRRSTRGVYCAGCANRISLRCTALTAALGWWGVLGLVWTPLAILRNARGGQRQEAADAQLLWRNAKAFLAQGKPAVAHALARQVAAMKSANALDAADLLAELHRAGVPRDTPPLVDPWRARAGAVALQGGLAMAAPVLVGALVWVYGVPAGALATPAYARALEPMVRASFSTIAPGAEPPGAATAAPPAPTCARPPQDGELLEGRLDPVKFGHHVEVNNGADGPTIIKLRDADTGRLRLAFFVSKGGHAKVGPLPDGAYRIQYAVGSALAQDCKSFTSLAAASEFPDTETFKQQLGAEGVVTQTLTYTLRSAPVGAQRAQSIDPAKFLSD